MHHADSLRPQVRTRYMGAAAVERGRGVRLWLRRSGAAAWWSRRALGVGVLPTWNCGESAGKTCVRRRHRIGLPVWFLTPPRLP